jgi:hypothetical protein
MNDFNISKAVHDSVESSVNVSIKRLYMVSAWDSVWRSLFDSAGDSVWTSVSNPIGDSAIDYFKQK